MNTMSTRESVIHAFIIGTVFGFVLGLLLAFAGNIPGL